MPTVGEQLRAAREAQHLTVTQVAEMTKIRSDHIRAIDQGNYDVFSAPVYIRGFVRTYAVTLKLDPAVVLAQLNAELAESGARTPSFAPPASGILDSAMYHIATTGRRMIVPVLMLVLAAGAIIAGVVIVTRHSGGDPLQGMKPGLYRAADNPGETLPLPKH